MYVTSNKPVLLSIRACLRLFGTLYMTNAFVLRDDTILCHQTTNGWWPLQLDLPPLHTQKNDDDDQQAYQIGYVTLLDSLAPSHWLSNTHTQKDNSENNTLQADTDAGDILAGDTLAASTFSAQAAIAITHDYAIANNIVLPTIAEGSDHAFIHYRELMVQLPVALSDQISQAMQLLRWQADTQFCSRCASPTIQAKKPERAMVCPVCQLHQYPRVQPCVIIAITRPNPITGEMQILLAHHHRHEQKKQSPMYGLIAGFVEVGESLEHAVVREVAEEVNISVSDIRYVSSQPWPFPSNLMMGFRAAYAGGDLVIQEEELAHADFFDVSNLPRIPPKGSIAYELIAQIMNEQGMPL